MAAGMPATTTMLKQAVTSLYRNINANYYRQKEQRQATEVGPDLNISPGVLLGSGTYQCGDRIGSGSFGRVVEAVVVKPVTTVWGTVAPGTKVAVKVIRNKANIRAQADIEIRLLKELNGLDVGGQYNIVRFLQDFMEGEHMCLVFVKLGYNLYEVSRLNPRPQWSLRHLRRVIAPMLRSLAFLARRDVRMIHCDIKPENVLLQSTAPSADTQWPRCISLATPQDKAIMMIDFGSSCKSGSQTFTYIQSRFYRAPEVILGMSYSHPIDMWSVGCVLAELHMGMPLFAGKDEKDQMCRFMALLGIPADHLLEQSRKTGRYFYARLHEAAAARRDAMAASPTPALLERPFLDLLRSMENSLPRPGTAPGLAGYTRTFEALSHFPASAFKMPTDWEVLTQAPSAYRPAATPSAAAAPPAAPSEAVAAPPAAPGALAAPALPASASDDSAESAGPASPGAARTVGTFEWGTAEHARSQPGYEQRRSDLRSAYDRLLHGSSDLWLPPAPGTQYTPREQPAPRDAQRESTIHYTMSRALMVNRDQGPAGTTPFTAPGQAEFHTKQHYQLLVDLLLRMLDFDPATRIKPMSALCHPAMRDAATFGKYAKHRKPSS